MIIKTDAKRSVSEPQTLAFKALNQFPDPVSRHENTGFFVAIRDQHDSALRTEAIVLPVPASAFTTKKPFVREFVQGFADRLDPGAVGDGKLTEWGQGILGNNPRCTSLPTAL